MAPAPAQKHPGLRVFDLWKVYSLASCSRHAISRFEYNQECRCSTQQDCGSMTGLDVSSSVRLWKRILILSIVGITLLLVPYVAVNKDSETFYSFLSESRFSEPVHRIFGWGDAVLHLDHAFSSEEKNNLTQVLKAAAFRDNTVIITALNGAWAAQGGMLELFLQSFREGDGTESLLDHLVIVALDEVAYHRCTLLHSHCFSLKTDGVDFSGDKYCMSSDYLKMMWRRLDFLRLILEMGYNFLFSDVDIMWFRDPFLQLSEISFDFQIACDKNIGSSMDLKNRPNLGFLYVRSNNRTISFYKLWYESRLSHAGKNEQDMFNLLKVTPEFRASGLSVRFLDTDVFSGICQPSKDFGKVSTMHANCCRGLDNKLNDLRRIVEDWKQFKSMTPKERRAQKLGWSHQACIRKKKAS